jgi:hypothetical protein
LPVSATRKPLLAREATATGPLTLALRAGSPSPELPAAPVPTTVVIVPVGEMRRTRSLPLSATMI